MSPASISSSASASGVISRIAHFTVCVSARLSVWSMISRPIFAATIATRPGLTASRAHWSSFASGLANQAMSRVMSWREADGEPSSGRAHEMRNQLLA